MTRDDVMRMTNEELNVSIQTHIFGIPPKYSAKSKNGSMVVGFEMTREECEDLCDGLVEEYRQRGFNVAFEPSPYAEKAYSSDIAAAWEVVERLATPDECITITFAKGTWVVAVGSVEVSVTSESASEAICRAALLSALKRSEAMNGGDGA